MASDYMSRSNCYGAELGWQVMQQHHRSHGCSLTHRFAEVRQYSVLGTGQCLDKQQYMYMLTNQPCHPTMHSLHLTSLHSTRQAAHLKRYVEPGHAFLACICCCKRAWGTALSTPQRHLPRHCGSAAVCARPCRPQAAAAYRERVTGLCVTVAITARCTPCTAYETATGHVQLFWLQHRQHQ